MITQTRNDRAKYQTINTNEVTTIFKKYHVNTFAKAVSLFGTCIAGIFDSERKWQDSCCVGSLNYFVVETKLTLCLKSNNVLSL